MRYAIFDFLPLIIIIAIILTATIIHTILIQGTSTTAMRFFMGYFFLVFGSFKLINLAQFAQAYSLYDLLAAHSIAYGYIYPFIELALGIAYLSNFHLFWINVFTFFLMSFSALGVGFALYKGEKLMCACLGAVFKLPMTWVTLIEDLLMATMALWMIFL